MSRDPVQVSRTPAFPAPLRPCPWEGLHKAGPYPAPPIPSFSPNPVSSPQVAQALPPRTFSLQNAPPPTHF